MNDYHPSNPFGRFIDGIVSKIKRPHRPHKRSHSSILIPSNHGVAYALPHSRRDTPLWRVEPVAPPEDDSEDDDDDDDSENERRAVDVTDGFVAIKSSDKTLAWLFLTGTNGQYILNAAENEKTLATLHKLSSAVTGTTGEIPVTLQIHPPDAETKSLAVANPLCATYNPNPSQPQPMTVTDCVDQTSPGRTEEGSQTFLLDEGTGVIRPTFVKGQADGKTDKPAAAQAADSPSSSSSSLSSSSTSLSADLPSPTNSSSSASAITPDAAAPTNGTQPSNGAQTNSTTALNPRALKPAPAAQNVILVFVPASKGQSAAAADVDSSAIDAQSSAVASSELTTTMTRTVTVFAAQTGASSSFTASDSASAAASQSVNSIGVELVSGSPPVATIASSTISAQAFASASASASSTEASAAAASVTVYPSSSVNAAAVASSLAASASASTSSAAAVASAAALASASSSAGASGTATPDAISSTSASASASASAASTASGSSNTFVAAVVEREAVSTEPYQWAFVADKRL